MRSHMPWLLAGVALVAPAAAVAAPQAFVHRFHEDHVLGTSMEVVAVTDDPLAATQAYLAIKSEIARLDRVLSTWRADSEISSLNAASGRTAVSPDLFAVIRASEDWREKSAGAFSARLGTLDAAWRAAERAGAAPDSAILAGLAARAASASVALDVGGVSRPDDVVFAVDGLAKGYVIDAALEAARRVAPGLKGLLLDIGGDSRCFGAAPDGQGWAIGVAGVGAADNAAPEQTLRLTDKAVATSGMGKRDRLIQGCAYSQGLSPVDGWAVDTLAVTVVADRAADADALASAVSAMPTKAGLALLERTPGAQGRIIAADGSRHVTRGWSALLLPVVASPAAQPCAIAAKPWPAGFTVDIDYTIPTIFGVRIHAPFVAVWITDADGRLVRTLFHLGTKRRYLDSNYVWWKAVNESPLDSVTRPSRAPGHYSTQWDGKDDAGRLVGQGAYTINIEASREHGGHSYQAIPLNLGLVPVAGTAAASSELGAAAAKYSKAP